MKTYYDLLSLDSHADADTIKKAFRREIARYHPDKVVHLGPEFQEMAATRAAALTVAYKTLSDPVMREQYDASVANFELPPIVPHDTPRPATSPAGPELHAPPVEQPDAHTPPPPSGKRRFETERAGRDLILGRAITARVRTVVESMFGAVETPGVRGFDAALVPVAKRRFMGSHPPRVLVKVGETVDATAVAEAWNGASRARVHAGKSPVVVLIFGRHLAARADLLRAMEAATRQRQPPDGPAEIVIVAVATADWGGLMLDGASVAVRNLVEKICV